MDVAGMWRGCGLDVAVLTPIYRFHLEPIYPLNKGCESQCRDAAKVEQLIAMGLGDEASVRCLLLLRAALTRSDC